MSVAFAGLLLVGSYICVDPPNPTSTRISNERNAALSIKLLCVAEFDFHDSDLDGNGVADYWVHDIRGLYRLTSSKGLIDPAIGSADAYPRAASSGTTFSPTPYRGYWFKALPVEGSKDGRNPERFAVAAFPARYGVTGRRTFIVNEGGTMWMKDLMGSEVQAFPWDPSAEGWSRAD